MLSCTQAVSSPLVRAFNFKFRRSEYEALKAKKALEDENEEKTK